MQWQIQDLSKERARFVEKGANKLKVWDDRSQRGGSGGEAPGSSRVLEPLKLLLEVNLAIYLYNYIIKFGQQKGGSEPPL